VPLKVVAEAVRRMPAKKYIAWYESKFDPRSGKAKSTRDDNKAAAGKKAAAKKPVAKKAAATKPTTKTPATKKAATKKR